MTLSYWEKKTWFSNIDYCVVGSGIVGLFCALSLKRTNPLAKVVVLERGVLPYGASTKNAGFACFGSLSEILSDLSTHSEEEVLNLIQQRYNGLKLLRATLGDHAIGFRNNGGYEVFLKQDEALLEKCLVELPYVNRLLKDVFKEDVFKVLADSFNFKNTYDRLIFNSFEGQLNVGDMMQKLLEKVQSMGVMVLNNLEVESFENLNNKVLVKLSSFSFSANHLFIATNAFSRQLIDVDLKPARNQVILTKPIKKLQLKGVFHLNEGYYYFRNIENRILLGGGRHLNEKSETTEKFETTPDIQKALEHILYNVILQDPDVEIDQRWSGILAVGNKKKPILKHINPRVHCAVRLGGMGVAIGSELGRNLAKSIEE